MTFHASGSPHVNRLPFVLSALALAASLLGAAAVIHQHGVQTFGALSGLPDPALAPRPNLLAVNVALEQYDVAALDRALDSLAPQFSPRIPMETAGLAGFHWLRQTFPWDQIEPARGAFEWAKWDVIVARAASREKGLIAVLNYSPAWARPIQAAGGGENIRTAPPGDPNDFAAFASAFAQRYGDVIDVYQIWDEPNLSSGWGGREPSAAGYAALLQAAYAAIHAADPASTVVAAALAPTVEAGPDNFSDLLYLQHLYDLGAGPYFDAAAGKPYGFYTGPDDRRADPRLLNFSRFTLLRQVMERNGDAHKLLWAGNFGWNTLDSPWGRATPEGQVEYTLAAFRRALHEWPWAGPLALENYQPNAPYDDPRWGFALADSLGQPGPLLLAINASNVGSPSVAYPGNHTAQDSAAQYVGDWELSDLGADIPEDFAGASIRLTFSGTDLGLRVRRGNYRAHLYVEVDGQPANLLPRDERGAYLVLTSPDLNPEVVTLPVASGLAPDRVHTAVIHPERGWEQWAFVGFAVGRHVPNQGYSLALGALAAIALLSLVGVWRFGRGAFGDRVHAAWRRLGAAGQLALTASVGGLLYATTWLTFGDELAAVSRRSGDALPIVVTALTAGLFYFSPSFVVALLSLAALLVLFYLRLDLALAFVALFIPFYLFPRLLWERGASVLEFSLWLAFGAWLLRNFRPLLLRWQAAARRSSSVFRRPSSILYHSLSSVDLGLLALVVVSALSLLAAERKDVALYEFRTLFVGSALYYFLLRATPLDRQALWRIADFFVLGAVAVAAIGLYQYVTGTNLITAEGGVERIRSVYGSPNNLALYLGRALPVAAAVAVMGGRGARRVLYAFAALGLGATLLLTFSKGGLLLGVPAALVLILVFWLGRRGIAVVGAAALAGLAALPLLGRLPRFADLLDLGSGTSFFRVRLWVSAWRMFLDHPLLGVGPDNFLYQYRSRYILPEAWQEPNLSHPHNIALDFLSRLGLPGLACGVWLQVGFWRTAVEAYKRLSAHPERSDIAGLRALCVGLMASVAHMLAHGLVDHSFFLIDLAFVFCLTLAVAQRLNDLARAQ
jgi:O-antigen ligase